MTDTQSGPDLLNDLAHEFAERYRHGEHPALTEYTDRYPDLAAQIRDLFPALVVMEKFGSVADHVPGSESAARARDTFAVPPQLGEYRILREIGRGGMGIVYEAVQESLGRHVALKVLAPHSLIGPTQRERFEREARAVARLHHSNIVPVFGIGAHEGVHYYAMQFIQGQGLDTVLKEVQRLRGGNDPARGQPLTVSIARNLVTDHCGGPPRSVKSPGLSATEPPADDQLPGLSAQQGKGEASCGREASDSGTITRVRSLEGNPSSDLKGSAETQYFRGVARLGVQVAEALDYAHKQGIIHRDIKPSNLLLDTQGVVWITDFGLVKDEEGDNLTRTGDLVGTIRYMSPERFDGRGDSRSDIYGLGATLYELLTLRPAFEDAARARVIERVLHEEPIRPRKLDPRIPRDLETVVQKALAKEPARRYQTAGQMADDLRRFLSDRPIRARRSSMAERTWRWCRRNPAVAGLLAAVAVMVVGVAISSSIMAWRLSREHAVAVNRQVLAEGAERTANERLWQSLLAQARAGRFSQQQGRRFQGLEVLTQAARLARDLGLPEERRMELRDEAIACLALPDMRVARICGAWPPGTLDLDFDASLEKYVRADPRQGTVAVCRTADGSEICRLRGAGVPFLSPDGQFLSVAASDRLRMWRLDGSKPALILPDIPCKTSNWSNASAFSPDSRRLAVGQPSGGVTVFDTTTGKPLIELKATPPGDCLAFDLQGRQLAIAHGRGIQIRDVETGQVVADLRQAAAATRLAWHPDGSLLAADCLPAGHRSRICVWDVAARRIAWSQEGAKSAGPVTLAFNHGGDLLASTAWDLVLRLWDPRTGKQVFSMLGGWRCLHFSPDDRLLAGGGDGEGHPRLWEVAAGREYRTVVRDPVQGGERYWRSAISPDGRCLAVQVQNGPTAGVALWDLRTCREIGHVRSAIDVLFDPSGALITNGPGGAKRWPLHTDPSLPGMLRFGPPEQLPLPPGTIEQSRDGRVLATPQGWGAFALTAARPNQPVKLAPHWDVRNLAVSPHGRWVATASFGDCPEVKVWDAQSGELKKSLVTGNSQKVAFSPDGRWLATSGNAIRVWSVGAWQEQQRWPGGTRAAVAFSPDSKILAFETLGVRSVSGYTVVRLVDPETGRSYAQLEDPNQDRAYCITFSPDGTRLVTCGEDSSAVRVWDLRLLRQQLAEMGLDWDLPPYPPAKPESRTEPLTVRVDAPSPLGAVVPRKTLKARLALWSLAIATLPYHPLSYYERGHAYELLDQAPEASADYSAALRWQPGNAKILSKLHVARARTLLRSKKYEQGVADLRRALAHDPDNALASNNLAWFYVTGPENLRDARQALPLAQKAVALSPGQWAYLNTLGVVHYRLGEYRQAAEDLQRSLREGNGATDGFDLFVLAMCHWRLGEKPEARACYDQAVQSMREQQLAPWPEWREELALFRAEAEQLMGRGDGQGR